MKTFCLLLLTLTTSLCFSAKEEPNGEALLKRISNGFSSVAKKAIPAVVYIESQGVVKELPVAERRQRRQSENPFDYFNEEFFNRFFGSPYQQEKPKSKAETVRGSGFIFDKQGHIITNNHVVANADKVTVVMTNGKKLRAEVVGNDSKTDLAVIKINQKDLPYLTLGNSDALEVGDWAIAVGNPFGLEATVTVGVVSAKGRSQLNLTDFEDFIQTDAAINPGNSGGPLLNVEGEVIGINTAIVSGSGGYMGIGFAIPSNMAKRIVDQLIKEGSVTRGFLGVTLQPIDSDLANYYDLKKIEGALVTSVVKGSPADIAGLKQEDIIVNYNGINVDSLATFRNAVSLMSPGSKLNLRVLRNGKFEMLKVTIATMPNEIQGSVGIAEKLGIEVQELTPDVAAQLNYEDDQGVVIARVLPNSPAAEMLLRPGSLIKAVNRQPIHTVEDFNKALKEVKGGQTVLLLVRQGQAVRFVALKLDD